jgi:hypothetical protein
VQRKAAFLAWITGRFFLRFHMGVILGLTFLAGLAVTKAMLEAGNTSLALRYGAAVAVSYAVFLLLIRAWIWYVSPDDGRSTGSDDGGVVDAVDAIDALDLAGRLAGRGGAPVARFDAGGGSFGGGGASGSFGDAASGVSDLVSVDADEGGCAIVVVLLIAALVLAIAVAGVYLVYAAPGILAEAAFEAFLASALIPGVRRGDAKGWVEGTVRSTIVPFVVMLAAAVGFGWAAQRHCPDTRRMADVIACARRPAERP